MSTLNQYIVLENKLLCEPNTESKYSPIDQKQTYIDLSAKLTCEIKMNNDNLFNKFNNMHQYDQPNQFYKVGPYILNQVIGKGNFSVVKLAVHTPTQMQVAIKILHKSKMTKETLEKTYREVHIMKQLSHPYIVRLYQVIDSVDWMFIVMEYALNGELFDHLSLRGRLTESDARLKFKQIIEAVEYCHQMNIVHRDLKAENLLLDKHQNIKLADFGFGSFYENSFLLSTWCGSPPYAAPELFKGEPYIGPKADIWSLGVILYAMVCGTLPFDEPSNIVKLREQVLSGWVRFPYFLSYECEHLIRMILNRSPMKRPTIETIKSHKWMQPVFENPLLHIDSLLSSDNEFWNSPSHVYNSQRCNTLGADSGFDEPIGDTYRPNSVYSNNMDHKDFVFNEHVLQIMERCGINRAEICEELINKAYGSLTAAYLLLGERLRIHRQTYPPQKQNCINNGTTLTQSKLKSEPSKSNKLVSDNNQIKHEVSELWDNINSSLEKIHLSDNNNVSYGDRLSPYENIKEQIELQASDNLTIPETEIMKRNTLRPEKGANGILNLQYPDQNSFTKNKASVIVDLVIPQDRALNEINGVPHNCSLVPVSINENVQVRPKRRLNTSPEFIFSYPGETFNAGRNSNVTLQPCVILDPSKTFKDTHPNSAKFTNSNTAATCFFPISNFYQESPSATCQINPLPTYYNVNPNPKFVSNYNQNVVSPKPIMITAQSMNTPPGSYNAYYKKDSNVSVRDQNTKTYTSQSPQLHPCSDSSLPYDNCTYGPRSPYETIPNGMEVKSNFNQTMKSDNRPEANLKTFHPINSFNTPLLIRANHYVLHNDQMTNFQPFPITYGRYSFASDQKTKTMYSEIPNYHCPTFNVIPIQKFSAAKMDCIKFS